MNRDCVPGCDPSDCTCSLDARDEDAAGLDRLLIAELILMSRRDEQTRAQQSAMRNPEAMRG